MARESSIAILTSGIWIPSAVANSNDGDVTAQFSEFSIVFLKNANHGFDGDYYVSNGGHVFPDVTGTWKLADELSSLKFSDGRVAEVLLQRGSLTMIIGAASTGGRTNELSGEFAFMLKHRG